MDTKQIAHDLTLLHIQNNLADKSPDNIVNTYYENFPKFLEICNQYNKEHRQKAVIPDRRSFGL